MTNEGMRLCPNCSEPLSITPDKLSLEYVTCGHCGMQHEINKLHEAEKADDAT